MTVPAVLRSERGASLVIALAFIAFMGVFSVAILAFTGVGSTTTAIARDRAAQRYAADAGMEHGIANLIADPSACRLPGSTRTWPAATVNERAVTYSCAAPPALLGAYGTIVTGTGGIAVSSATATGVQIRYQGSLHAAGPITFGSPAGQASTVDGDVTVAGPCPVANVSVVSPYSCIAGASTPAMPSIDVYVPAATAPAPTTSGACTTLYPGRYGAGGRAIPSFDRRNSYYLANGVYYVNGGAMTLQGAVFGGTPGAGESQAMTGTEPCRASEPAGTGYSGSGVAFVLGGTGSLRVQHEASRVELFARVPGGLDAGATPGLGIWAGSGSSVITGSGAYADTTSPAPIVSTDTGAANVVVHGITHVPTAETLLFVHANALAGGAPVFRGGLVTSRLQVTVVRTDTGMEMTVAGSVPGREPVLTATVPGTSGAAALTVTATIRPDGTPLVSGWRSS